MSVISPGLGLLPGNLFNAVGAVTSTGATSVVIPVASATESSSPPSITSANRSAVSARAEALSGTTLVAIRADTTILAQTHVRTPETREIMLDSIRPTPAVRYETARRFAVKQCTPAGTSTAQRHELTADQHIESRSAELRRAIEGGLITADHVHAEIGELFSGTRTGRRHDRQITLCRSVGVAVQDAAAAGLVPRAAQRCGVGTFVALEDGTGGAVKKGSESHQC